MRDMDTPNLVINKSDIYQGVEVIAWQPAGSTCGQPPHRQDPGSWNGQRRTRPPYNWPPHGLAGEVCRRRHGAGQPLPRGVYRKPR
jgi:hypothetical protein